MPTLDQHIEAAKNSKGPPAEIINLRAERDKRDGVIITELIGRAMADDAALDSACKVTRHAHTVLMQNASRETLKEWHAHLTWMQNQVYSELLK